MRLVFLCLGLAAASHGETLSKLWGRGYAVLPEPQQVELGDRDIRFGPSWSLEIGPGVPRTDIAVTTLEEELRTRFGLPSPAPGSQVVRLAVKPGSVTPGPSTDSDKRAIADQAYRLEVGDSGVAITANAPAGLFYGVVTFVQLLRPRGPAVFLPEARITDWPDLHLRHIYWDDAHHLERLSELKRAVRQAAFFKIDGFALKLEGHFQFRSAGALVEPYALTPAEYQELTDYGLRYHVQVVPYLDAPGHIAFILKHPEYAKFRAFPESNYEMCATNPQAVDLLKGMFQDLVDANRGGEFVYLSTDEAYYIGMADNAQCREKAAAGEKGSVGKLLADFIGRIANPLHAQGRTVIFWGEYPLKVSDIDSLPSHLVNGEVYGPAFDPVYRKHGIRQMIYTATEGEERLFPEYFRLPDGLRVHPSRSAMERVPAGFGKISYDPARSYADLIGAVVAGWGDMGLHPETFWPGYATITAAAWKPGSPSPQESLAAFYTLFYGERGVRLDRVYQLMSRQAQFWTDSWESNGPSPRKPLFGNSQGVFQPRRPVQDQTLPLPRVPSAGNWAAVNARRLQLAAAFLAENDELLGLLNENVRNVQFNRYNLEVYAAIAHLCRQNLEMLLDIGRMASLVEASNGNAGRRAVESLDRALDLARRIRQQRNLALRDAAATWQKSWYPRVAEANGRKFLHDLDDVKDHLPDRTVDMSYLVYRELQLPFGEWVEAIRSERNKLAAAAQLPADNRAFDWKDTADLTAKPED